MPVVDSFREYYDPVLKRFISSNRQRERLMKKEGVHYAEDNPKNRELRKMAEYFKGKRGDRYLDGKGQKEWEKATKEFARKEFRERVEKDYDQRHGR